jgi:hypothetical protein
MICEESDPEVVGILENGVFGDDSYMSSVSAIKQYYNI